MRRRARRAAISRRNSTAHAPVAATAIGAVAASILTAAYHMRKDATCTQDLGPDHFDRRTKAVQTKRLVARLQNLGFTVQISPLAA